MHFHLLFQVVSIPASSVKCGLLSGWWCISRQLLHHSDTCCSSKCCIELTCVYKRYYLDKGVLMAFLAGDTFVGDLDGEFYSPFVEKGKMRGKHPEGAASGSPWVANGEDRGQAMIHHFEFIHCSFR